MNVAVRTLNNLFVPRFLSWLFVTEKQWTVALFLGVSVLLSSVGLIYVKDSNRRLEAHLQSLQVQYGRMHAEWSQLLLEESTWSSDARIANQATHRLQMMIPKTKQIVSL
ncbi:MAG: cell division protein FtsL [Pseudomonadota bacterium]|nr:cell division protein FtsL [Gammaproteobacteria bacterium]MBU1926341.1 cell division protein FtsL [Gammaproteobacteria bacterium]MBU2546172.1 cell division protein FtsL [Gammaproteobacteria bacterium]